MLGRMFGHEFHALLIFQKFLITDEFAALLDVHLMRHGPLNLEVSTCVCGKGTPHSTVALSIHTPSAAENLRVNGPDIKALRARVCVLLNVSQCQFEVCVLIHSFGGPY